jgi:hypothetical protein
MKCTLCMTDWPMAGHSAYFASAMSTPGNALVIVVTKSTHSFGCPVSRNVSVQITAQGSCHPCHEMINVIGPVYLLPGRSK